MEGALEGDEPAAAGMLARGLERPFDRLGAARREVHDLERRGQEAGEPGGEVHLRLLDHLTVDHDVQMTLRLRAHRSHHLAMRMADVRHAHAGEQIEIRPAAHVPHRRTGGARDGDAERAW